MPATLADGPSLEEMRAARRRLAPYTLRTPLLRLNCHDVTNEIYLKLENLQPVGSFKVRPMGNALLAADPKLLRGSAYTASSGNSGLGLAWMARQLGIPATVYTPDSAPVIKLERIREYGARLQSLPDEDWWQIIENCGHPDDAGFYVDAVRSIPAMAGNGTIGLEIVEQLPDVDTVIVPFGGGGVACGIGSALAELKSDTRIIVAESDAAAPLSAAFAAGRPVETPVTPSFISGAGAPFVLEQMWPLVSRLVHGTTVVPVAAVEDAIRLLSVNNRVVAEGAGAISVAGALAEGSAMGKTVCIVTGGNIDPRTFARIIGGASA